MSQLLKFGLILGVICMVATLVLAATYGITKPKIDEQLAMEEQEALKAIITQADTFSAKTLDGIEYFEAVKGERIVGYCLKVTSSGYNGYIRMIAGIDTSGVIKGVRVLEQYETPGLGARINEIKRGESESWFLRQFAGKTADTITVKKDIDAITGATISSKAVADGVSNTVKEFLAKVNR